MSSAYEYDPLGNLTYHANQTQLFDAPRPHAITQRMSDGALYGRDPDGNVTSITGGSAPRHFKFDSANQLVCIDSSPGGTCLLGHVYYDVDGRRVAGGRPEDLDYTIYVHDGVRIERGITADHEIEIRAFGERIALKRSFDPLRNAEGTPAFEWLPELPLAIGGVLSLAALLALAFRAGIPVLVLRRPGYAGLSLLLVVVIVPGPVPPVFAGGGTGSVIYWELADPLGSGTLMLDDTGRLLTHRSFTPFGTPTLVEGDANWLPTNYAGHLWEEDAGLYYMQARWYDAKSGTFLSVDPLVADASSPQSFNAYSYVRNNPLNFIDPSGMSGVDMPAKLLSDAFGRFSIDGVGQGTWDASFMDSIPTSFTTTAPGSMSFSPGGINSPSAGAPGGGKGQGDNDPRSPNGSPQGDATGQDSSPSLRELEQKTYVDTIGPNRTVLRLVTNVEGTATIRLTTEGKAVVSGKVSQTRDGLRVGQQVKIGTPDAKGFQLGKGISPAQPLIRTLNVPQGPRTLTAQFNNFGPDPVTLHLTVSIRTGPSIEGPVFLAAD